MIRYKIIGGITGMMVGGPIGAAIGIWIGHKLDRKSDDKNLLAHHPSEPEALGAAVVALGAKLAKADGSVAREEVATFKRMFSIPKREEARIARLWDDAKDTLADFEDVARYLGRLYADRPVLRRHIYLAMVQIADADGVVTPTELRLLDRLRRLLGVANLPLWPEGESAKRIELEFGRPVDAVRMDTAFRDMFKSRFVEPGIIERAVTWADSAVRSVWQKAKVWGGTTNARPILAGLGAIAAALGLGTVAPALFPFSEFAVGAGGGVLTGAGLMLALPKPRTLRDDIADAAAATGVYLDLDQAVVTVETARAHLTALDAASESLVEPIKGKVGTIRDLAGRVVESFLLDPREIPKSHEFTHYYLQTARNLVESYVDLSRKRVQSDQLDATLAKVEQALADLEDYFRSRYVRDLDAEAENIETDIEVLQKMMKT
ncbi:MAG: 5-bromo-4-chloroindolyl phosphate hydrolysis family protein [Magnetospiraceae bacterium]